MAGSKDSAAVASGVLDEDLTPAQVGAEIRDLRKAKRLTIKELSLATSLSVGHLSEIERGIASPSIKTLRDIAKALGVTIGWFLHNAEGSDPDEREYIVRASNRRTLRFSSGITDELLSPNLRGQLELVLARFPPGATEAEPKKPRSYSPAPSSSGSASSASLCKKATASASLRRRLTAIAIRGKSRPSWSGQLHRLRTEAKVQMIGGVHAQATTATVLPTLRNR